MIGTIPEISYLSKDEVFKFLDTFPDGLSDDEAKKRILKFGTNEIEEVKRESLCKMFFKQFTHFLALLLWVAASLCFLSEFINPGGGMLKLGMAIVSVIVINAVFAFVQEYRAERAIEELRRLLPFRVNVLRGGVLKYVDAKELVPGDVVLLSEGDKVPADSRIIESEALTVNNAPLTGESEPISVDHEACKDERLGSCRNIIFAGTTVLSGSCKAVVFSTGMRTELGRIAHLTSVQERAVTSLQKEIAKTSKLIALIATSIGIVFFVIGYLIGRSFWENFVFTVGVIVALVPEGMLPTVSLSLAMSAQRMAKKKALIKTLISVETLGSITVICTDKTGTLTLNKMEVKRVFDPNEKMDVPYPTLPEVALLCNNVKVVNGEPRGDPTEVAIYNWAMGTSKRRESVRIKEFPFDPERMRMSTVHKMGGKMFLLTKGAPEAIFKVSTRCLIKGEIRDLSEEIKRRTMEAYESMTDEGLRVIAFGYKEMIHERDEEEENLVFTGLIGLVDPIRKEVPEAIKKCHEAGIRVIMFTGDGSRTAFAIAKEIGLVKGEDVSVIEGYKVEHMSDEELMKKLSGQVVFSRMVPKQKLRIVKLLKSMGERVAVTGDGVNDAPALKVADIGVAMGSGTDVAKEAADMILLDDNFATIVSAVEEGRAVFENIRKFVAYFFTSNVAELVPYIVYALFRVPLPLNIMQILAIDLGTDIFPGLALGGERPTEETMKQPPRKPQESLLNLKLLSYVFFVLGPIEASAGIFGYFYVLMNGGWQWGQMLAPKDILYLQATTACLAGIILVQVFNVFACRSFKESLFKIGIFSNRFLLFSVAIEMLLALGIIYTGTGNTLFGTYPIDPTFFLILLPFGTFLLLLDELKKLLLTKSLMDIKI